MNNIVIYTNGNYRENLEEGTSAFVILDETETNIIKSDSFYYTNCTNNYAELMAIIRALEYVREEFMLNKKLVITIKSNSKYCVDGCSKKMYGWRRKGTFTNRPNGELWKNIYYLIQIINREISMIDFIHVKGHSKVKWNEYCDKLANELINKLSKIKN